MFKSFRKIHKNLSHSKAFELKKCHRKNCPCATEIHANMLNTTLEGGQALEISKNYYEKCYSIAKKWGRHVD